MPSIDDTLKSGWTLHQAGDLRGAEAVYRRTLAAMPSSATAWCYLGMACHDQGRYEDAVTAYREALRIKADFPVALSNLGNTLQHLGRPADAEASCREALRIHPDYVTAHTNLGVTLMSQGRLDEARASFEHALRFVPDDANLNASVGVIHVRQGALTAGAASVERALRIDPGHAEAHRNRALVWLLSGDFQRGWPEYEWRWRTPRRSLPALTRPRWTGERLAGRTILLYWEQGLGDTIQFVRYARLLKRQGARVVVCCQAALLRLLERCEGIDELVAEGGRLPAFDVWSPLLSLPGVLNTTLASIPGECGYLTPDPALAAEWRGRLQRVPGLRVGICWQGSTDFHADRQRSIPLAQFSRLSAVPGVSLIALQKGPGLEQIAGLEGGARIVQFPDLDTAAGPFMDTAAIMQSLDLVIASDTSVPHLAGAMGVPAWVALSVAPDWRWLLEREDSPWYPSLRLFRQTSPGEWTAVFDRIAAELAQRVSIGVAPVTAANPARSPPAGFNALVHARHGRMLYNRNDRYIGRSLELYGEFSEQEIELLQRFIQPGDWVVEGGANIGTHTLPFAGLVGAKGAVIAFEPQRLIFQTLCANVALNSLTNVQCRNEALAAARGEIVVPLLDPASPHNFGGLGLGGHRRGEPVPVMTIDALSLPACSLIKLDVEGMEAEALSGAMETIRRHRPVLYVENDREDRSARLIELILSLDYRLFWHAPPLFREGNYSRNPVNVFAATVSVNMLCVHRSSGIAIEHLRPVTGPASRWNGPA